MIWEKLVYRSVIPNYLDANNDKQLKDITTATTLPG